MLAAELQTLLTRLRVGVAQPKITLRCDCENLETVYVHVDNNHAVWVTDSHRTFQYLGAAGNSTYVSLGELDMNAVRQVCNDLGVAVLASPPDGYPGIGRCVTEREPIALVVAQVAEAVERVFHLAMKIPEVGPTDDHP